jgi:hypothetical protein
MNGRLENILDKVQSSTGSGLQAELHYLLDRLRRRDRIIGSLTPEQWKSVASRVPPGHRKERDARCPQTGPRSTDGPLRTDAFERVASPRHSARPLGGNEAARRSLAYSTSLSALRIGPPPPASPVQLSVRRM